MGPFPSAAPTRLRGFSYPRNEEREEEGTGMSPMQEASFQASSFLSTVNHGQGAAAEAGVGKSPLLKHPFFSQNLAGVCRWESFPLFR